MRAFRRGSSPSRSTHAAPYDPAIWRATVAARQRMFRFGLEFACGSTEESSSQFVERVFLRSRRWTDFHQACLTQSEHRELAALSIYWASTLYNTAAQIMNGYRHFQDRAKLLRQQTFPFLEVSTPSPCWNSPHASIAGYSAPVGDPIWEQIRPPFDYSCACMVSPVGAATIALDSAAIPKEALGSHDWMSVFPAHLRLTRFTA
jgi:hypothetical protein